MININENVTCNYIVWFVIIPFKGLGEWGGKGLKVDMERKC